MTLGVTIEQLCNARASQRAIVAAVAYDLVGLEAIVVAGEQTGQPIIAQVGSSAFRHVDGNALIVAAHSLASDAATPVGLHLDHSRDLDEIRRCLDAGYTSIMIDGSRLNLAENIALTKHAVDLARPYGVWVEAELGHIAGDEDRSRNADAGAATDPGEAAAFVAETGVDALAVCIGNVHGRTTQPVVLDLGRLGEIAASTDVPLVLHGASGVPAKTMVKALPLGVAKLNVNADLRATYLSAMADHRAASPPDESGSLQPAEGSLSQGEPGSPQSAEGSAPQGKPGRGRATRGRGGIRATADVVIDIETLAGHHPSDIERLRSELASGAPITGPALDRLLCDAAFRALITDGPRTVLAYNRATPAIPDGLRRAVRARDRCCQFTGCDRPHHWCDLHHIVPRHRGGPTELDGRAGGARG